MKHRAEKVLSPILSLGASLCLASLCIVSACIGSTCSAQESQHQDSVSRPNEGDEKTRVIEVNLGVIGRLSVPVSWEVDDNGAKNSLSFIKRRHAWSDCLIRLEILPSKTISERYVVMLRELMQSRTGDSTPTRSEITDLNDLSASNITFAFDKTTFTTYDIKAKRVLLASCCSQVASPCEPIGKGRTRRILLN